MASIKLLSANMINKIAAGEVIERPASVVKELVENAIDAGASRIELTIEKSGSDLIRVIDDGSGIPRDELPLALTSHATSKIAETDDLFKILTLGFRGEALASIAEVSQLLVRSRTAATPEGAEITSHGGELSAPAPCGAPVGTCIEVRNLFFNIPARRKFLKSASTEFGHITEAVIRLALPYYQIHFVLRHNGKVVYDLPPVASMLQRIDRLFGSELAGRLIHVSNANRDSNVKLSGYVGHPDASRPNNNLQYLFLNQRFIRDRSLGHALSEAYRGLLPVGRCPVSFLNVSLPPDFVDVNVHPTKNEVRFADPSRVYSSLLGAIREEFLRSDLTSRPRFDTGASQDATHSWQTNNERDPQTALDDSTSEVVRNQILDWAQGNALAPSPVNREVRPSPARSESAPVTSRPDVTPYPMRDIDRARLINPNHLPAFLPFPESGSNLALHRLAATDETGGPKDIPQLGEEQSGYLASPVGEEDVEEDGDSNCGHAAAQLPTTPDGHPVIQIHQRYLIFETETGMAIVDQHALHERILYEKIRSQMEQGKLSGQMLLVPVAVDLTPPEVACVLENKETLAEFGLIADTFGGNTIIITGYPTIAERLNPEDVLHLLLTPLMNGQKPSRTDLLDEMMHQMACKAAVKAGDFLQQESIHELLIQAQEEVRSHHCPHGRPSTLVFTCPELDKLFKRT
ncbi:MAG: DNA mismatch repair endonuclease MutL [Planctomycetia bacterium]|nr:DNA mismatch repair endonuclease MutL [Planctomycetia bacterium]